MRKILLLCLLTILVLAGHELRAQARAISGKVSGADGVGLPGVTVVVRGTSLGASTNAEGIYSLEVPASATALIYSSIGYESKTVTVGNESTINVTLAASATGLDEVVVVGYGATVSRRELTGSISTIAGTEIAQKPVQSFEQALQGRAPGVNITTPNGVLNNPPVVRIRGVNSISLSSSPLYVIDGIPAYSGDNSATNAPNNPLSNVNPNDIESIEVLKDAASAAIYGSRASNGVILVTTKKGKKGQSRVTLDSWAGWTKPVRLYDLLGAQDYMSIKNEAVRNLNANRVAAGGVGNNIEGFLPSYNPDGSLVDTRWYDYIYRTGFSTSNNVSFSGGTEKTNFYASVGYTNQKGMLENNQFKRASARLNVDHKVYKNFTIGARVAYSNSYNSAPNSGSLSGSAFSIAGLGRAPLVLPPNIAAYNPDGTPNLSGAYVGSGANVGPAPPASASSPVPPLGPTYYNPVVDLMYNDYTSESNEIQGSVYANWELLKGLNIRTSYGINNVGFEDKSFQTALGGDGFSLGGSATNYYRTNKRWNWQNTVQYDRTIAENHNISLLVGGEQQRTQIQRWGAQRTQAADNLFDSYQGNFTNIAVAGNLQTDNYLVSYFGRLTYDFAKKYLISFNARRDGYSAFAKKWGNFYGAGAGYIISEENFWKNSSLLTPISFFKFTGSYGEVGNIQGVDDYGFLRSYSSGLYASAATLAFSGAGNPDLTWESSKKTDVGLSFGLLQDKIQGDFAYYRTTIDDLILNVPLAPSRGVPFPGVTNANYIQANVGSMRNSGIELNLRYNAVQKKNFTWTISGNLTTLKNEVLVLATEGQRLGTATSGSETVNYTEKGRPIGSILAVTSLGVNPDNGQRMIAKKIKDADGKVINTIPVQYNHLGTPAGSTGWTTLDGQNVAGPTQLADGEYYNVLPKWYGGFDNTFTFKNFDLGIFIQYSGGNYIYNGTKAGLHDQRYWNNDVDILDRWTPEHTNAKWPRVVYGDNVSNGSALVMSSNVEKGDFVRLRNVSLGYSLASPVAKRLGIASARLYVQVQNAALLTKYKGIDPEISSNASGANSNTGVGVDRNSVGQARTYTVGFNIGF